MEKPCLTRFSLELQIYERVDMFRQQIGNLDLTVGIYNSVQRTMLNVEKPLILQKIEAVDAALKKGLAVSAGPDWCRLQRGTCRCQLQATATAAPLHAAHCIAMELHWSAGLIEIATPSVPFVGAQLEQSPH